MRDLLHPLPESSNRPHSVLVPHVRLRDAHGLIGTRLGCLACEEHFGFDYVVESEGRSDD